MTTEELDALADPLQSDSAGVHEQLSRQQPAAAPQSLQQQQQQQQQQGVGHQWAEPSTPYSGQGPDGVTQHGLSAAAAAENSPLFKWTSDGSMMEELLKAFKWVLLLFPLDLEQSMLPEA